MRVERILETIDWSKPSEIEIVLSGFIPQTKKLLEDKLHQLGFNTDDNWTSNSRILIMDRVSESNKYFCASAASYPIVQSDWVKKSAEYGKPLDPRPYLLPPFKGLCICVTQLSKEERVRIEKKAVELGATYTPSLHQGVTHLIAKRPEGPKYDYAKKLRNNQRGKDTRIAVVTVDWFNESVRQNYALKSLEYLFPDLDNLQLPLSPINQNIIPITQQPVLSQDKQRKKSLRQNPYGSSSRFSAFTYLNSCYIHLLGFSDYEFDKALSYIEQTGAHPEADIESNNITHVVLEDKSINIPNLSLLKKKGVHIVTYEWLRNCLKYVRREDEQKYSLFKDNTSVLKDKACIYSEQSKEENDALVNIYETKFDVLYTDTSHLEKVNDTSFKMDSEKKIEHYDDIYEVPPLNSKQTDLLKVNFFHGYSFYIHPEHTDSSVIHPDILITRNGGKLVKTAQEADYILCNSLQEDMIIEKFKSKYVTVFWLKACIKNEKIENVGQDLFFTTIIQKSGDTTYLKSKNQKATVFTTIDTKKFGYNFGRNIIERLGGVYIDVMNKKVDYLICGGPESCTSKKYSYTLDKSDVIALDLSFLYESVRAGHFVNPSDHIFHHNINGNVESGAVFAPSVPINKNETFNLSESKNMEVNIIHEGVTGKIKSSLINSCLSTLNGHSSSANKVSTKETAVLPVKSLDDNSGSKAKITDQEQEREEKEEEEEYEDRTYENEEAVFIRNVNALNSLGNFVNELINKRAKSGPLLTQIKTQYYPSQEETDESHRITRAKIEKGEVFGNLLPNQPQQRYYRETSYAPENERDKAYNEFLRIGKVPISPNLSSTQTALSTLANESQFVRYDINISETCSVEEQKKKVFMLSSQSNKDSIANAIVSLGGEVVPYYNSQCTHLVIETLSKTEKFLSAVAAQLHIVHPKYVEDSKKAGKWLPEDEYLYSSEYGTSRFGGNIELCQIIRSQCMPGKEKAFSSWVVYLVLDDPMKTSFYRIFTAGGAIVLNSQKSNVTPSHVIFDNRKIEDKQRKQLWDTYHDQFDQTLVVSYEYVAKYLVDKDIEYEQFHLKDPYTKEASGGMKRKISAGDSKASNEDEESNSVQCITKKRRRKIK
jgi:hypothetical protein